MPLSSEAAIGYFGGGQLGMMLSEAGKKIGRRTVGYAPKGDNPARHFASAFFSKDYHNSSALNAFARMVDAVTFEFENVPLSAIERMEHFGVPVRPSKHVLFTAQDRLYEKQFFDRIGVPAVRTLAGKLGTEHPSTLVRGEKFPFPAILKTRRDGYDGKGQLIAALEGDLGPAWAKIGKKPWILEHFRTDLAYELSVMVACDMYGSIETYPAIENEHRNNILRISRCPGPSITPEVAKQADQIARVIAGNLGLVGILGVEMFVLKDGMVLANEIAPRPHNSGHGTIEGCEVSQFEQLLRIVAGEPVRPPNPLFKWEMRNLLGEEIYDAQKFTDDGYVVHVYGKQNPLPGRKMGHATKLLGTW